MKSEQWWIVVGNQLGSSSSFGCLSAPLSRSANTTLTRQVIIIIMLSLRSSSGGALLVA